ncbi:HAUS augmin-like complex subunit 2 [Cyprinodon tularosa]|uniref:HAUS augmin-like complex subunit 2 n=1 Tax=Cyprinodon tularosa TaxID=77115 RepID=UPI0018E275DE|nr:HAUS augmin-like complex subunit 2 [Cyprinodon tularosa]
MVFFPSHLQTSRGRCCVSLREKRRVGGKTCSFGSKQSCSLNRSLVHNETGGLKDIWEMHRWDLSPFSVTPAASLLSRCVSVGAVSQGELDQAFSDPDPVVSWRLREAELQFRKQKQLEEVQLQLELLKVEEQSADVTQGFHLGDKTEELQLLGNHLLDVLKDQKVLVQRLMRPLARTGLPVPAHMQRFVVDSVKMMIDFIERLEEKLSSAHCLNATSDRLALLESSLALLLTLAAESETLFCKIQQWRSVSSSSCSEPPSSGPSAP